jgi:hypothetical protein
MFDVDDGLNESPREISPVVIGIVETTGDVFTHLPVSSNGLLTEHGAIHLICVTRAPSFLSDAGRVYILTKSNGWRMSKCQLFFSEVDRN